MRIILIFIDEVENRSHIAGKRNENLAGREHLYVEPTSHSPGYGGLAPVGAAALIAASFHRFTLFAISHFPSPPLLL